MSDKYEIIIPVYIDVLTAMCVIGQIQLASRHPANTGTSSQIACKVARELQQRISEVAPEYTEVIEQGWNPEFDC